MGPRRVVSRCLGPDGSKLFPGAIKGCEGSEGPAWDACAGVYSICVGL